jgi:filamentous hemagglutinin family protein
MNFIDRSAARSIIAVSLLSLGTNVQALPVNGVVVAGAANVAVSGSHAVITQSSQNAAINWQSFNIGQSESVRFVQPNSNSVALNQVLGSDPSNILGSLSANGKVFLVNPNGILFGQGANVNVGGLVASTVRINNTDFMAGNYHFSGAGDGAVINQGELRANADGGYVALLGANVSNQGVIVAKLGTVSLSAGSAMTLDVAGDGLLNVTVNAGVVNALVHNGGLIQADGGQVLLTTQVAGSLLSNAVNNTGIIQAQTIGQRNGRILLLGGMETGTVSLVGSLDASAPNGGDGGFIETSAAHVNIADNAHITTTSAQGKMGNWLIDPVDFTIAVGSDISGAALSGALVTTNTTIQSSEGTHGGVSGDINVNEPVAWTASGAVTTLTLNAVRDVNFNAAVTTTRGNLVANAGRDVVLGAPVSGITTTDGNLAWTAGRDVNIAAPMTTTRGTVLLRAGSDSSGPGGLIGGRVYFALGAAAYVVTGPGADVTVDYTPINYGTPTSYAPHFTLTTGATLTQHMLVFATGSNKSYDGNSTAALTFKGAPTDGGDVSLVAGTAIYDSPNAGSDVGITYSGYSLGGADASNFAFVGASSTTSGAITPKVLVGTVTVADKVYDGGSAATINGRSLTGVVGADVVSYSGGTANFDTTSAGSGKSVSVSGLSLTGANAANYTVNMIATSTANITPAVSPVVILPAVTPPVVTPPVAEQSVVPAHASGGEQGAASSSPSGDAATPASAEMGAINSQSEALSERRDMHNVPSWWPTVVLAHRPTELMLVQANVVNIQEPAILVPVTYLMPEAVKPFLLPIKQDRH